MALLPRLMATLFRLHAIVPRAVLDLREAKHLHDRRHVVGEAAAQALLEAIPALDRIVGGAGPGLDSAGRRRLLFIRAAERHPAAMRRQHLGEIIEAAKPVAQLGLAD